MTRNKNIMFCCCTLQASVSLERLEKFLCNDELDMDSVDHSPQDGDNAITIDNASFKWSPEDPQPTLEK